MKMHGIVSSPSFLYPTVGTSIGSHTVPVCVDLDDLGHPDVDDHLGALLADPERPHDGLGGWNGQNVGLGRGRAEADGADLVVDIALELER